MKRKRLRARRLLLLALLLGATGGLGGWVWLRRSLPRVEGTLAVSGLERPLEVVRDAHAIPHVLAQSESEAYFGLGYVHAQDRLWQMELQRRVGSGTLAEVLGEAALRRDRLFRTLGLRQAAERNLERLNDATRTALEAYAAGVNAFLDGGHPLPPEFTLLRVEPRPWTAVDSLTWLKVMAWTLSTNLGRELTRWRLLQKLSPRQLAEFLPPYPGDEPIVLGDLPPIYRASSARATGHWRGEREPWTDGLGSNNWAVDGSRSQSGAPLLANDPHLGLSSPCLWYLAHLRAPGSSVIGATLPGVPGVVLGRTETAAWAFTNTLSDVQDSFLERLVPGRGDHYQTPDGARPFEHRREVIAVRGGDDQTLDVRISRHGPVISDVHEGAAELLPEGYVLALRWSALEPDDRTLEFVIEVARARVGADVLQAARHLHSPPLSVVYADAEGEIGFVAAGRVPVRRDDNALRGLGPAPGWHERNDWQGYLPFERLPQHTNPDSGRIVTANHKITPEGYPHWLTADWKDPIRARRIEALLDRTARHSVDTFERMQRDVYGGTSELLMPALRRALRDGGEPSSALERRVVQRLLSWDLELDADRAEPLLFVAWVRELAREVYADELGELFEDVWAEHALFLAHVVSDDGGQGRWCDHVRTPTVEACAELARRALRAAIAELTRRYGSELDDWSWGRAHVARSRHVPMTRVPILRDWFDVVAPSGGGLNTVDVGAYAFDDDDAPFENRHSAGLRAIYDLSQPERSVFAIRTGQSGHPLSPHYRDFSSRWAAGEAVPMSTRQENFARGALGRLRLEPSRK